MTSGIVNRDLLPGNVCFGCGHDNPNGLKIDVSRDPEDDDRLVGLFQPASHMIGFPGITHGGAIYTAFDCLAVWTPTILRSEAKAMWILRSSRMKYFRPARQGVPLSLSAWIEQEGKRGKTVVVHTEARDPEGKLLAEGSFEVVPLPPDRFEKIAGIEKLPENWRQLLGASGA